MTMRRARTIAVAALALAIGGCGEGRRSATAAPPQAAAQAGPELRAQAQAQAQGPAEVGQRRGDLAIRFDGEPLAPGSRDSHVDYDLSPSNEVFFVHVPQDYSPQAAYGLVVFIDAGDEVGGEPEGWAPVLDGRKLLFVAPENAGNDQPAARRLGLAVMAALEMSRHFRIDPRRIYVAGFSGGARMASHLGFYQSGLFHGTIQNCGTDFHQHVPQVAASTQLDTAGQPYGFLDADQDEIDGAHAVRFALITGSDDFRRGNILDIYNGGFAREGFQAKLFDVPGMGHDTADAATLSAALDFIDPSADAAGP